MKTTILSILFIASAFSLKAQVSKYHPFPDSSAYWSNETESNDGLNLSVNDYGVLLSGDTIVNGKTYHKLYEIGGASLNGLYNSYGYSGAFRDDTLLEKVYMLNKGGDSLLYDFTQKVGDSIGSPLWQGPSGGTDYISSVDSVNIFGSYRKRLNISNAYAGKTQNICSIIEGIGNTTGSFGLEAEPVPFEEISKLLCFRQNTDSVQFSYGYFYYPNCHEFVPLSVNSINEAVSLLSIYPNPTNGEVSITYQLRQGQYNSTLQLYNTIGKLITTEQLNKGAGTMHQNIQGLTNGVYYYTVSTNGVIEATSKLVVIH